MSAREEPKLVDTGAGVYLLIPVPATPQVATQVVKVKADSQIMPNSQNTPLIITTETKESDSTQSAKQSLVVKFQTGNDIATHTIDLAKLKVIEIDSDELTVEALDIVSSC